VELAIRDTTTVVTSAEGGPLADPSTFASTVQARLPDMVRLAARIAPGASPDDVVQEALIRAWRYRNKYDPRLGTLWGWLMGIVVNEARRAVGRRRPIVAFSASEPPSSEEKGDIEAAVRRLPPRQRLSVECFYYADLSITETAAVMRCSEGTVKSTLADARNRLRLMLADRS
jgi:RNA polymerase sigma-70 factor (ECF subfamily)